MNETIIKFLKEQTCASICCVDEEGKPYCFSCYYTFHAEEGLIYFKSSANSHHSALMKKKPFMAGTILPDKLSKLTVKGLQFEGVLLDAQHPMVGKAPGFYLKKHPLALAVPGEVWTVKISNIKMTDSTLGFGKKIIWKRTEDQKNVIVL